MRAPVARAREGLVTAASCVLGAVTILVANALIVGIVVLALHLMGADDVGPQVSEVSAALTEADGAYRISEGVARDLRDHGCWAMLIDERGEVAWSLDLPDDVPSSYTPAEVASFARWYLNDHPVTSWQHGEGLVVVGLPEGSVWKYSFSSSLTALGGGALLVAAIFLADLVVLVALARILARRSWRQRDDARNEWVAAVSHDVRTPLSAVVADASSLAESPGLDEAGRLRAERIVSKSRETAELLADLNTANRLRYAMEPVDARPVHLAAVVRQAVAGHMEGLADGHELELDVSPATEGISVRGSEALLRRMVSNLVGNSIRHNPQGCRVAVSLDIREGLLGSRIGRRCVLCVKDDGRGFGAETLSTLRQRPGSDLPEHGLGLVIVRRIAAAHGGWATFENGERGGCTCTVVLPASAG